MSTETPKKEKKPIKCAFCGHEWPTGSTSVKTTCTHCGKKTPNPHFKVVEAKPHE